jgi:hypothetical protein
MCTNNWKTWITENILSCAFTELLPRQCKFNSDPPQPLPLSFVSWQHWHCLWVMSWKPTSHMSLCSHSSAFLCWV